jgi:xylulokinase
VADADSTILAIDLGTSGPKVALMTLTGEVLGSAKSPTPLSLPSPGAAEQKPADWWNAIVDAAGQLWERKVADPSSVIAVCTTAQWAGTVPVDERGAPLRDAIIWMDTRGAKYVQQLVSGVVKVEGYGATKLARWLRRTGGVPSLGGKEPVAHILYLRHEHPKIYEQAYKFLEPKDWINAKLTGKLAASFDSIALHWVTDNRDIDHIAYDDVLLRLSTLPRDKLPDLKASVDVLGTVTPAAAKELGIPTSAKVVMGTPDVQSAAIGSGAVRDYEAHVYIGTSSWVTCHVPFKKTDILRNMASLPSALPGRYFVACAQETAGACVEWLRDQLLFPKDGFDPVDPPAAFFEQLEATAGSVPPGSDKVLFTPWLFGERCPVADPHLRAAFFNLSLTTTRAHLCRAILEGVAFNVRWLLEAQEKFVGRQLQPLRMIGGGANSALWCQIHADVLNRDIAMVERPVECNARGAGLLAAIGLGHMSVESIADVVKVQQTFRPRPQHRAIYDELYGAYRRLYRANRGIYAQLNREDR